MSILQACFYFFLGAFGYMALAKLIQCVQAIKLIGVVNYHSLSLGKHIEMIYQNTLKFSREKMEESGEFTKEEIGKISSVDEGILKSFQDDFIQAFFKTYPTYIHKSLPFKTWDQAMSWVKKVELGIEAIEKKEKRKSNKI